jgi:hypothetical protein
MIYGWDISTSIVGLSVFKGDGSYVTSYHCDLRKVDGQLAKADAFEKWLRNTAVNVEKESFHFIEERLGGFAGGRTSAQVLMKLAQFNAIVSYIIWNHSPGTHRHILYIHPSTWKSLMKQEGLLIPKGADKKELTLTYVRGIQKDKFPYEVNRNGNSQPWCYDMADSYCIGRAGWKKLCTELASSKLFEGSREKTAT